MQKSILLFRIRIRRIRMLWASWILIRIYDFFVRIRILHQQAKNEEKP
jgi:hypothetical protein